MASKYVCYDVTTDVCTLKLYAQNAAEAMLLAQELQPGVNIRSAVQTPDWNDTDG